MEVKAIYYKGIVIFEALFFPVVVFFFPSPIALTVVRNLSFHFQMAQVSWLPRPGSRSKGITKAPSTVHDKVVKEHSTPDSGKQQLAG